MSRSHLELHRRVWSEKPVLRALYDEWWQMLLAETVPGRIVELGSGPGTFKQTHPHIVGSDIIFCPWNDLVVDAAHLPFGRGSIENLVMTDVLHHVALTAVSSVFEEATRVLQPG